MKAILLSLTIVFLLWLLIETSRRLWKKIRFRQWSKHLKLSQHADVFQALYQPVNGHLLSKKDRQVQDEPALVYGEIEFIPFVALLSLIHIDKDSIFIDLGSGTGKAVLTCAMVFKPRKAIGIEKLNSLFAVSEQQRKKLQSIEEYSNVNHRIEFLHQDFLKADLNEASHIFINASAFFGEIWDEIEKKLQHLPRLEWIITTSKALNIEKFICERSTEIEMSWGVVTAYIHHHINRSC